MAYACESENTVATLAVIGAGSWGTALAMLLARHGHDVRLWGRDAGRVAEMATTRRNERYLPGHDLPPSLTPTADLQAAVADADDLIVAVPSHAFRECLQAMRPYLNGCQGILWATKGLEPDTASLAHVVAADVLGDERRLAALSGPSFAGEVARGLPTAVTIASTDDDFARVMARRFHDGTFRVYISSDVVGVGIGGAAKNVLAIVVGFADGLGFGANTRALLITRGLSEMMALGEQLGGQRDTQTGMAGLGDLLLTCSDDQSRNRRMGLALAAGASVAEAEATIGQTVEGVRAASALYQVVEAAGLDAPIIRHAYYVLHQDMAPREAAQRLMDRPFRSRTD